MSLGAYGEDKITFDQSPLTPVYLCSVYQDVQTLTVALINGILS